MQRFLAVPDQKTGSFSFDDQHPGKSICYSLHLQCHQEKLTLYRKER